MVSNLNSGKPWSQKDLANLERAIARGYSIELIAGYLMRDARAFPEKAESGIPMRARI